MNSLKKINILILILAVGATAAVWFWRSGPEAGFSEFSLASLFSSRTDDPESVSPLRYVNQDLGFSFEYPADMQILELDEVAGKIILGEGPQGAFQIFVMPFDEGGPLTAERIKKDLPNLTMENPSPSKINEIEAVSFIGSGGDINAAELWFVSPKDPYPHGNYLYQVTSALKDAELLEEIMQTWESKN